MSEYSHLSPTELMLAYRADGVAPQDNPEDSLFLSVQGGGMAGATGLGALNVFESEGLLQWFKGVAGISVGAVHAAAALGGQTDAALNFHLSAQERGFIDKRRFWRMVNLGILESYLAEELNVSTVMEHSALLGIGLTDRRTQEPIAVSSRDIKPDELIGHLRNATELPIAAGWTRSKHTDGGTSWLTTPDLALHFGATHVIDISNHPHKKWEYNKWPTLPVDVWNTLTSGRLSNLGKFCKFALDQTVRITNGLPDNVETIYPKSEEVLPGTFEQDPEILMNGYRAGQQAAVAALGIARSSVFALAA